MANPVPAGSDVSSGTYKCTNCGNEMDRRRACRRARPAATASTRQFPAAIAPTTRIRTSSASATSRCHGLSGPARSPSGSSTCPCGCTGHLRAQAALPLRPREGQSPIGYQKVCKTEEQAGPDKEIVKAFEAQGRVRLHGGRGLRAAKVEGVQDDRHQRLRALRGDRPDLLRQDVLRRALRTAPRRSTRCSCGRWRTPSSPRSRSSSCATGNTSARSACARA